MRTINLCGAALAVLVALVFGGLIGSASAGGLNYQSPTLTNVGIQGQKQDQQAVALAAQKQGQQQQQQQEQNAEGGKGLGIGLGIGGGAKVKQASKNIGSVTTIVSDDNDYPVNTAVAGRGVPGDCMGSAGAGLQLPGVGGSIGSNFFDEKCRAERRAKMLEGVAKVALLCQDGDTREALMIAHTLDPKSLPCPQDQLEAREAAAAARGGNGEAVAMLWSNPAERSTDAE